MTDSEYDNACRYIARLEAKVLDKVLKGKASTTERVPVLRELKIMADGGDMWAQQTCKLHGVCGYGVEEGR